MKIDRLLLGSVLVVLLIGCSPYDNVKDYAEDGNLYRSYHIDKDSLLQGKYEVYYEDGSSIFELAQYVDGLLDGPRTLHFQNGQVEILEQYHRDTLVDTLQVFYESGKLKQTKPYVKGVLVGEVFSYATFVDNEEQGPFVEYHATGHPKWRGTYRNGDKEFGELQEYDESGTLIRKLMCNEEAICATVWTKEEGYLDAQ